MTSEQFVEIIEQMFGKYNPAYKEAVIEIIEKIPQNRYEEIIQKIVLYHKSEYKEPPSIPTIMEIIGMDIESEAENEWLKLRNKSDMVSVLITNMKTQAVVESFGGWYNFCQYRDENEYSHKDFIERYKNIAPAGEYKILRGYNDMMWNSEIDYSRVQIIGDKNIGMNVLEKIKSETIKISDNQIKQLINKSYKTLE